MKVIWEVEDGYIGKSRPQTTEIPDEEFEDNVTEEDKQEMIEQSVQDDFDQKITWQITRIEE